jgi:hypothetical protein
MQLLFLDSNLHVVFKLSHEVQNNVGFKWSVSQLNASLFFLLCIYNRKNRFDGVTLKAVVYIYEPIFPRLASQADVTDLQWRHQ